MRVVRRLLLAAFFSALEVLPVFAETLDCTPIASVPFSIGRSGTYCLTRNITTRIRDEAAILIVASDVVLDLNGHRLRNAAGSGNLAVGIRSQNGRNVTIRNGTVQGFHTGIFLYGSSLTNSGGHLVEDILADSNHQAGIWVLTGTGVVIRDNRVLRTAGSGSVGSVFGIRVEAQSYGVRILNNDVDETTAGEGGTSYGIFIAGPALLTLGTAFVVDNRIQRADTGVWADSSTTAKCRNNLFMGVTTPLVGCPGTGND